MLVECDQLAQRRRVELREQDNRARPAAGMDLVRDERFDPLGGEALTLQIRAHSLRRLPIHERLSLRHAVGDREVLVILVATGGLGRQQQVQRRPQRSLVQ